MQYMSQGLPIALIGYVMVFVVLCLMWGILEIMKVVFASKDKKKVEKPVSVSKPVEVAKQPEEDEEELVAILTAAVAASLNTSTYNLKIKSFKRSEPKSNSWFTTTIY